MSEVLNTCRSYKSSINYETNGRARMEMRQPNKCNKADLRTQITVANVDLTIKMGTAPLEAALAQHVDTRINGLGCATTKTKKKKTGSHR